MYGPFGRWTWASVDPKFGNVRRVAPFQIWNYVCPQIDRTDRSRAVDRKLAVPTPTGVVAVIERLMPRQGTAINVIPGRSATPSPRCPCSHGPPYLMGHRHMTHLLQRFLHFRRYSYGRKLTFDISTFFFLIDISIQPTCAIVLSYRYSQQKYLGFPWAHTPTCTHVVQWFCLPPFVLFDYQFLPSSLRSCLDHFAFQIFGRESLIFKVLNVD